MDTPLWDAHFYKLHTMSLVVVDVDGTIVKATVKLLTVLRFDHLGCTIEVQHSDMDIVHWAVHVVSCSKNNIPFQLLLTYAILTMVEIKQKVPQ
jgi:hypothetical protein